MAKRNRYNPYVQIEITFKCECGNEGRYDPARPYNPEGFNIVAFSEGGCETCSTESWKVECGRCQGVMER